MHAMISRLVHIQKAILIHEADSVYAHSSNRDISCAKTIGVSRTHFPDCAMKSSARISLAYSVPIKTMSESHPSFKNAPYLKSVAQTVLCVDVDFSLLCSAIRNGRELIKYLLFFYQ
jgi:hypothetical protein